MIYLVRQLLKLRSMNCLNYFFIILILIRVAQCSPEQIDDVIRFTKFRFARV